MHLNVAAWVAHRWVKWVVLVLSLVMLAVMGSLGAS